MNSIEDGCHFAHHLLANLCVIGFGEFSALVFEIKTLNLSEQHFLLSQKKIPFGFLDDGGFNGVLLPEQRNAYRGEDAASKKGTEEVDHQSSGVSFRSSSSISFS